MPRVIDHATCIACGCLCDDITLRADGERIVDAVNACPTGERWLLSAGTAAVESETYVAGRPVGREDALDRACHLLRSARSPVFIGLTGCPTETTTAALALADRIKAVVDTDARGAASARLRAIQRVGRVSATLGEVKGRADVVVFWCADPVTTHPRHFERYSVAPRGRFIPDGRAGRSVIVIDSQRSETAQRADLFVQVPAGREFEVLWVLRALVRGVPLQAEGVARSAGVELTELAELSGRLACARYGAWFHDPVVIDTALVEAQYALVRDLNAHTRFVTLSLGAAGNAAGAEAATTWQTGLPARVDFGLGAPRSWPDESSAAALLERGEADLAVTIGADAVSGLRDEARAGLGRIPCIRIAPPEDGPADAAEVAFATSRPGIDAGGTVTRTDGVILPLRPALASRFPSDREWLKAIFARLDGERG